MRLPSRRLLVSVTAMTLTALPGAASAAPLLNASYDSGLSNWTALQRPTTPRIVTEPAPGSLLDPNRPQGAAMRVELRPGDLFQGRSRAEAYGRTPRSMGTAPIASWPDPVGATRFYAFSIYLPPDFPMATDTKWLTVTQWKGLNGGSPPVALEIKRDHFRLGGARANDGVYASDDLGPVVPGAWTRFVVGMRLDTDPATGWVEVRRDGMPVVPRTSVATVDVINGAPDPIYLKQGLYRSTAWSATQVADFSPVRVGETLADVG